MADRIDNVECQLFPQGCALDHDPEPWLTSGMAMAQVTWWGNQKWAPRKGYCQDQQCAGYDAPATS